MEPSSLNIYQRLVEVRKCVTAIGKDAKTNFGEKFKYVSSNNILSVLRPAMDQFGLVLECRITGHSLNTKWSGADRKEHLTELEIEFVWVNADKPEERIVCPFYGQGLDTGEKGVGKAATYAEKYFLLKFFNIPTDEDDPDAGPARNGNGNNQQSAPPPQYQQPAQPNFDAPTPAAQKPTPLDAMTRDEAMSINPGDVRDLATFQRAMIGLGITDSASMGAAKLAAGFAEDKLKDLDTVSLQAIFATAQANMMEEAVA